LEKRKVGIALGSGAARGLAHIGVLDVLQKESIPIHMVAGTSAGAMIGALYAYGKQPDELEFMALNLKRRTLVPLADPAIPKSGFIKGRSIKRLLFSYFGRDVQFDELRLPFTCIAADIETGEEVLINHGSVLEAIRASISIPGVFSLVRRNGRYLVDGALVNPIPVDVLMRMGADFIIAVNVIPETLLEVQRLDRENKTSIAELDIDHEVTALIERLFKEKTANIEQPIIIREVSEMVKRLVKEGSARIVDPRIVRGISMEINQVAKIQTARLINNKFVQQVSEGVQQLTRAHTNITKEPNIINVLMQSLNISAYSLARTSIRQADISIEPQVSHIGVGEFFRGKECIELGKAATLGVVPEIKRLLEIE